MHGTTAKILVDVVVQINILPRNMSAMRTGFGSAVQWALPLDEALESLSTCKINIICAATRMKLESSFLCDWWVGEPSALQRVQLTTISNRTNSNGKVTLASCA
jgi:hypothetical protein